MSTMLEFFEKRAKEIDKGFHDPHHAVMLPSDMIRAARVAAQRDRSDPFVYGRAMLRMREGLYLPAELLATHLSV